MKITIISDKEYYKDTLAFAKELQKKNVNTSVIMPLYEGRYRGFGNELTRLGRYTVDLPFGPIKLSLYATVKDSVQCFFISAPNDFDTTEAKNDYYKARSISIFCHGALEVLEYTKIIPDYIFSDSPRTALIPALMMYKYRCRENYSQIRTMHYISKPDREQYSKSFISTVFGIDTNNSHVFLESEKVNLTRSAIICATQIFVGENAVSILYDRNSILHHSAIQFGFKIRKLRMGIDYNEFSPENDNCLMKNYSADDLRNRKYNKRALQKYYGFKTDESIPLIAIYPQNSKEIITRITNDMMRNDIQLIILDTNNKMRDYVNKSTLRNTATFESREDIRIYKNIFSGADMAIFGGYDYKYGNPMYISSSYGCVPMTATNKYFDLGVTYFDKLTLDGNAFTYDPLVAGDFLYTLWDALSIYKHSRVSFEKLITNCMKKDFSIEYAVESVINETKKSPYFKY